MFFTSCTCLQFLFIFFEPILFYLARLSARHLPFHFHLLGFIRLKSIGDITLLGGPRWFRSGEFLDVSVGIGRLQSCRLVGPNLFEIQVLDDIGCTTSGQ